MQGKAFAVYRTGLWLSPTFSGSVFVNRHDPTDILTRPGGRTALGGTLLILGGVLLFGACVTGMEAAFFW